MKKIFLTLAIAMVCAFGTSAQKFALVDMDYILGSIPDYEMANEQLNQLSQRWQKEVEAVAKEAETMYKNYQKERSSPPTTRRNSVRTLLWQRRNPQPSFARNISVPKVNFTKSASRS